MAVAVKGGMLPFGGGTNSAGRSPLQQQIDRATFTGAEAALDAYHAGTATYAGAPAIPASRSSARARASYCLQAQAGTTIEHEIGPGGVVTAGAC